MASEKKATAQILICLIFMDPCIVVWLSRNTSKIQLCNRMYYSKVYWRLKMFRAAHRSSSGALNCICSLWFIYTCGDRPLPWQRPWGPPSLLYNGYRVYPESKVRPGRAANYSPLSSAEVLEEQSYTSTHPLGHNRTGNGVTLPFTFLPKWKYV